MQLNSSLVAELQHEMTNTQKLLERIPTDKLDWTPHPKSRTVKQLALHICKVVRWAEVIIHTSELELTAFPHQSDVVKNTEGITQLFSHAAQQSLDALQKVTDDQLAESWILRKGAQIIFQVPKAAAIRSMCFNHLYHHRAQLGVYLRLLNVPLPGMYGASADELEHFKE